MDVLVGLQALVNRYARTYVDVAAISLSKCASLRHVGMVPDEIGRRIAIPRHPGGSWDYRWGPPAGKYAADQGPVDRPEQPLARKVPINIGIGSCEAPPENVVLRECNHVRPTEVEHTAVAQSK